MTAEAIAKALGGRKAGGSWTARCPAHDDRTPSLSIRDSDHGKVLVHCHAGCDQRAVIAALKDQGLWADHGPRSLSQAARRMPVKREQDQDDARRSEAALAIWQVRDAGDREHRSQTYLASRGTDLLPPTLRFHVRSETSLGRHLAGDGGAGDGRRRRTAAGDPSHLPRPRWRRESTYRAAENDARPLPWRRRCASPIRATC